MDFSPYKFHPTRYAEDPYDLLIYPTKHKPKFKGICACESALCKHEGVCGVEVERDAVASRGYFVCYDCEQTVRRKRDRTRNWNKRHA